MSRWIVGSERPIFLAASRVEYLPFTRHPYITFQRRAQTLHIALHTARRKGAKERELERMTQTENKEDKAEQRDYESAALPLSYLGAI